MISASRPNDGWARGALKPTERKRSRKREKKNSRGQGRLVDRREAKKRHRAKTAPDVLLSYYVLLDAQDVRGGEMRLAVSALLTHLVRWREYLYEGERASTKVM